MHKIIDIPVVASGQKYVTTNGVIAVKDGMKIRPQAETYTTLPKPDWLRIVNQTNEKYVEVKNQVKTHKLSTVCEEAKCPNIAECWSHGTATIMLMGSICTRACRFCAVDTGNPHGNLDVNEPQAVANTVALMGLEYVVLT